MAASAGEPLVLALPDRSPQLAEDVFVAPTAVVVGSVTIGSRSSVWYGSVVRADSEDIVIGADCNIQDGCVLHSDPGEPVLLGDRVTVGHRAVVHGARVESDVLIGMGAIVLNGARIGTGSIVAAGAVVRPGSEVPPGSLVAGVPAAVRRPLSDDEQEMIRDTPREYVAHAAVHRSAAP
jgi:carbonic anhydrase/acetyltransferase-like protein (isoleucine patch superfamily)